MSGSVSKAHSRVANESKKLKKSGGDPSALLEAKRLLAEEKIRAQIERTVAAAPPLSAEQLDRLAVLLRGAVDTR